LRITNQLAALLVSTAAVLLPAPAFGEIEKMQVSTNKGVALYWWPKVQVPKGWHQDKNNSYRFSVNAIAPDGFTFSNAGVVLYARAIFKPLAPEIKSLDDIISNDRRELLSRVPGVEIADVKPVKSKDGKSWRSIMYKAKGNWERVSYGQEGDFYVTFTLRSSSPIRYMATEKAYEELVRSYK
jgi:hypothetical protein